MVKKKITLLRLKKFTKVGFEKVLNALVQQGIINQTVYERIELLVKYNEVQDKQLEILHKQLNLLNKEITKLKKNK